MLENTAENRKHAISLIHAGRLDAAQAAYEALLEAAPDDPDLMGLSAAVALQQGRLTQAEALFGRSLELGGEPRIHLRNMHNFSLLLRATGRDAQARALAAGGAPEWPEGAPAEAAERDAVLWLAETLLGQNDTARARRLLDRALPERSGDAAGLLLEGRLRLAEDDAAGAVDVLAGAVKLAPVDSRPLIVLSCALRRAGEGAAARAMVHRIARAWPVYADPPQPSQGATLLVFNRAPTAIFDPDANLRRLHFMGNYASQVAWSMRSEYRFLSLFANLPEDALPGRLPAADLVLNNIANSEEMNVPGRLQLLRDRVDRIGLPVINHPDQIFQTTREKNAILLTGIPNLKVPRVEYYQSDPASREAMIADIGQRFDFPVILRKTKVHQSTKSLLTEDRKTAVLIADPRALRDHLERYGWDEFYAVEFVDLKREDGFYRSVRAIIIDGEVIVTKPGFNLEWMVAGWRSTPAGAKIYRDNPHTIEESNRISRDPEKHLGAEAMAALAEIGERMPLDMFGVDFDVDRDGRVVFFEAGAAMSFLSRFQNEPKDIRLPIEPFLRVDDAFRELVARRIAEGRRGLA